MGRKKGQQGIEKRIKGLSLVNQGWFRMIGQNPVIFWVTSQVGWLRFTQCHRKRSNASLEECRQAGKLWDLKQTCLPSLGKEVISLYVCPVKDPQSNHSPVETSLGWPPLPVIAAVGKVRDLGSQRNYSSLKQLLANYGRPSGFNLPQAHLPLWGMTKDYKINQGYKEVQSVL